jgi:hypothetical protein
MAPVIFEIGIMVRWRPRNLLYDGISANLQASSPRRTTKPYYMLCTKIENL